MTTGQPDGTMPIVRVYRTSVIAALLVLLVAGALVVEPRLRQLGAMDFVTRFEAFRAVAALAFGLPGAYLVGQRQAGAIGRLMLAVGAAQAVGLATGQYGLLGIYDPALGLPLADQVMWVSNWIWAPAYLAVPTLFLLLFPDGRVPSRRWRPALALSWAAIAAATLGWALQPVAQMDIPGFFPPGYGGVVPVGAWLAVPAQLTGLALAGVSVVAAIACLVHRHRVATGTVRRQVLWVLAAGIVTVVMLGAALADLPGGMVLISLAPIPLPLAVTVAVVRHRLWDVDLLLARTLALAALTAVLLVAYACSVLLLGGLFDAGLSPVAVAVVAAIAQPVHARLRARANQLVFGDRDDPVAALRRLGARLSVAGTPDELISQVAESVAHALGARYAAVEEDGAVIAHWGGAGEGQAGGAVARVPLEHRGERVGTLVVAEPLRRRDRAVLAELAPHVAVTVRAHRLTADLERSRQRLLAAREEERARLMQELHDGVGPTLAALAFQADKGRRLVAGSPEAERLLDDLSGRIRATVVDIRAIVQDLRPPPLDDLGLVGALNELARGFMGNLAVEVAATPELPYLPAPVELAAYRIAAEALTNAARHAEASRCAIRLGTLRDPGGHLELRVEDDGSGLPERPRDGVGLGSMRRRAAELGGTFDLSTTRGGTNIVVRLPLKEAT